jgi:alpha-tubulin suppressor-like RCC1 family protein
MKRSVALLVAIVSSCLPASALAVSPSAVFNWGDGEYPAQPVQLPTGVLATSVAAANDHVLAIGSSGQLLGWGWDGQGQLGAACGSGCSPTSTSTLSPTVLTLPSGVSAVEAAAGGGTNDEDDFGFSLVLSSDGRVFGSGYGGEGQLSGVTLNNQGYAYGFSQISLPANTTATAVAANLDASYVLTSTGQVLSFGGNSSGELGRSGSGSTAAAVNLPAGDTATAIAAGTSIDGSQNRTAYALALTSDHQIYEWGDNPASSQRSGSATPHQLSLPGGETPVAIAAGGDGYVLMSDGSVWAWGENQNHSLGAYGNGTDTPVEVTLPSNTATAIAGGAEDGYALLSSGALYGWGDNNSAELAMNNQGCVACTPTQITVPNESTIDAIASSSTTETAFALAPPIPSAP